jgi:DNA repair photolyase
LAPVSRQIDGVVRTLFGPLLGPEPVAEGWQLQSWDCEQGFTLAFERGDSLILIELEDRNEALQCWARTEVFNVNARRMFQGAVPLDEADRHLVDLVVAVIRDRESDLPNVERATTSRRTAVREILVDRVLMPEGRGGYYLNPYAGCMIGCPFCYVSERADLSRRLEGLPKLPWGHYVDVKINAPEVLRREVKESSPGFVRMSPILTDPYQPIERRYRITRQCLEVFLDSGFVPGILTRARRITEDLDLLRQFPKAIAGFSIPTDIDSYRRIFEPGADPVDDRFEALKRLHEGGLTTIAIIQPMLPMNVENMVAKVAPYVRAVRIDRMHFIERVRSTYLEHNLADAMTTAFFDETEGQLREGFESHGVLVGDFDDLAGLVL